MVLEIRLSNFFSIKDEVVLDMQAASIQTKKAKELEENKKSHVREDVCLRKMVNFCWLMSLYRYFRSIQSHGKPV